jgi:hypothetical protein
MTTQLKPQNSVTLKDEVVSADLGDERLNARLGRIVEELGANPNLSIPAATSKRAEMEAAYRFFDNDSVTPDRILQPHMEATHERISQCDIVLLVQGTTELDLTRPDQQVDGAGPMDCETRRGAFLHPLIAFRPDGVPLGTVWQKTWAREKLDTDLSKAERKMKRDTTPIEEKGSLRWIEGLRAGRNVAAACPNTTCVCVSDSESDIYELFSEPRSVDDAPPVHFLVRAAQERCTETGRWLDDVRTTDCLSRMIATLGGYVDRPKTEPGPETLWIGLQRLHCFSLAWDTFGPKT